MLRRALLSVIRRPWRLLALGGWLLAAAPTWAEVPTLFTRRAVPGMQKVRAAAVGHHDPRVRTFEAVKLNFAALDGGDFSCSLNGKHFDAAPQKVKTRVNRVTGSHIRTISGVLLSEGRRHGRFTLVSVRARRRGGEERRNQRAVSGVFEIEHDEHYTLSGTASRGRRQFLLTGVDPYVLPEPHFASVIHSPPPAAGVASTPVHAQTAAPVVDILIAFVPAARDYAGGLAAAEAYAAWCVAQANTAYAASEIALELHLAGVMVTQQNVQADNHTMLQQIALDGDGYYDDIHPVRAALHADLVYLFTTTGGGVSFLLKPLDARYFSRWAYALGWTSSPSSPSAATFLHEVGHLFGGAHNLEEVSQGAGLYPYSHGLLFQADNKWWKTWLSYGHDTHITYNSGYYSNPNVTHYGVPVGSAGVHDVARTHNESAATLASYSTYYPEPAGIVIPYPYIPTPDDHIVVKVTIEGGNAGQFVQEEFQLLRVGGEGEILSGSGVVSDDWQSAWLMPGQYYVRRHPYWKYASPMVTVPDGSAATVDLAADGKVLSGTFRINGTAQYIAGKPVSIYHHPLTGGAFARVATAGLEADGKFTYSAEQSGYYQARYDAYAKSSSSVVVSADAVPTGTATPTPTATSAADPSPSEADLTLSISKKTAKKMLLQAALKPGGANVSGAPLELRCNGKSRGSATTGAQGTAHFWVKRPPPGSKAASCAAHGEGTQSNFVKVKPRPA